MRYYFLLFALAVSHVRATLFEDLTAFLESYPEKQGISSEDAEFLEWKQKVAKPLAPTNFTDAPILPKAYVLQLRPGTGIEKRGADSHSLFHRRAAAAIEYDTRQEFKAGVFFGLSIQVKDDTNETTLLKLPGVLKVWPVKMFPRPVTRLNALPLPFEDLSTARKAAPNTPIAGPRANTNSIHVQTEVNRVHTLGIKGKGIKIGIVDTGVDYKHESLGGCFGEGCKVSFGYDFVGDLFGTNNIPVPDSDPYASCTVGGHGTHVAGTIAMQDPENSPWSLVGVAPEATIGMYRVFGCSGSSPSDIVMKAMEQAIVDKVDILSLSLGSTQRFEEDDQYEAYTTALEAKGIAVIVSNGNNGALLAGLTSTPAIGSGVIGVGSVQNSHFSTVYSFKDSRGRSMKYSGDPWPVQAPASGLVVHDMTKLAAGTNSPIGCTLASWRAAAAAVTDKENSIVAVPYGGTCSWATKMATALSLGFKYTIVYALAESEIFNQEYNAWSGPEPPNHAITLNAVDGRTLIGGLAASKEGEYKVYFSSNEFESLPQVTGGLMSNFSSWGPTSGKLAIKPQFSAPGGSILSTWPLSGTGYAILSGTSMAAPYVTGAFALLKSQFPQASVQELREKLQSTARTIPYVFGKDIRTSIAQQGSGMINVYDAIHFESSVSPSELNLGDLDQLKPHQITIKNNSNRGKHMESYLPVYSGFIKITNNNEIFSVPYLGQPYSRFNAKYFQTFTTSGKKLSELLSGSSGLAVEGIMSFNFSSSATRPYLDFATLQTSTYWRVDIVPYNTTFVPTHYGFTANAIHTYGVSNASLPLIYPNLKFRGVQAGVETYGIWTGSKANIRPSTFLYFVGRNILDAVDGEVVGELPRGDYRALMRFLRWGGDVKKEESYESWLSPIIRIGEGEGTRSGGARL